MNMRLLTLVGLLLAFNFNVNLLAVRDTLQARLTKVIDNNGIPE